MNIKVCCPICNEQFHQITAFHAKKHNLTLKQLKVKYPKVNLKSDVVRSKENKSLTIRRKEAAKKLRQQKLILAKERVKTYLANPTKCKNCSVIISLPDILHPNFNNKYRKLKNKKCNNFCSQSCAATYNNTHKQHGTTVSKLEKWLCIKLKEMYPSFTILFNNKEVIGSELDIYIPQFKIAFEINGIHHYKPIYGQEVFTKIKNNDNKKIIECSKRNVKLYVIDTSNQQKFNEITSEKYIKQIADIIDSNKGGY